MPDQLHQYTTAVEWTTGRNGTVTAAPRHPIAMGAPPEFGGRDDVWSPEHLCVAAVNSCVMLTFLTIAVNSKIAFRKYSAAATGTLEKVEGRGMVITRVLVKPHITIGPDVDRTRVERLVKMAEKHCFISNSLNATVSIEAEIVVE
jgi:organic hydroperoxide reductase OsmC/OhrA